jgi:nitrogen permease regulator 2-like protein
LLDDSNTINLKLFPSRAPPAPVYAWHVPLSTVRLSTLAVSSDLTLTRILPFIDGISSVAQISQRADTDLNLTRKAIAHLLFYGCIILLDIFQFSATYAPTAEIGAFIEDIDAQEEAVRYVSVGQYRRLTEHELDGSTTEKWGWKSNETGIDKARLVQLYASLRHGLTLRNWCLEHDLLLAGIDVRRLITFGVIKGFLYRIHKYAVVDSGNLPGETGSLKPLEDAPFHPERVEYWRDSRRGSLAGSSVGNDLPLAQYLDGMHCFDEICTELQLGEKRVSEKMKSAFSEVQFIYR